MNWRVMMPVYRNFTDIITLPLSFGPLICEILDITLLDVRSQKQNQN